MSEESFSYTEIIDLKKLTDQILDFIDSVGFTVPEPIDSNLLRNRIIDIIRDSLESQGIRTQSTTNE